MSRNLVLDNLVVELSRTECLVQWLRYPMFESMGKPASQLDNAPDVFLKFLSH